MLIDGDLTLTDSSVICQYQEDLKPSPPLLPAEGFCFGAPTLVDIAPACFIRNAHLSRFQIDATRWPRTAGWMARTLALPAFERLAPLENATARRPIAEHREALLAAGAPLSATTYGSATPRRGVMPI
jgi:glutathione S-transferase